MRSSVDSLIVTDENDRYLGTISVEDIKAAPSEDLKVSDLLKNDRETFLTTDDAKRCFASPSAVSLHGRTARWSCVRVVRRPPALTSSDRFSGARPNERALTIR